MKCKRLRTLIVREPRAKLHFDGSVLVVQTPFEEQMIGIRKIKTLFVNYRAHFDMKDAIALARICPVYFIDYRGVIVAKVSFQV